MQRQMSTNILRGVRVQSARNLTPVQADVSSLRAETTPTRFCFPVSKGPSREMTLALITEEDRLWTATDLTTLPFQSEPWWAFFWPGGYGLTRFVFDHPHLVCGKSVLDVGSGCGSVAIASGFVGARCVLANDIDPWAGKALRYNIDITTKQSSRDEWSSSDVLTEPKGSAATTPTDTTFTSTDTTPNTTSPPSDTISPPPNTTSLYDIVHFTKDNLIGDATHNDAIPKTVNEAFDVVFVGDMLYDTDIGKDMFAFLKKTLCLDAEQPAAERRPTRVFIGDPGRHVLQDLQRGMESDVIDLFDGEAQLRRVAQYPVPDAFKFHGLPDANVWELSVP